MRDSGKKEANYFEAKAKTKQKWRLLAAGDP
jgi:hypothetical protein